MERFLDAYFYVSRHQLVSKLEFQVTVWRARPQDEETRQRAAVKSVRWGDRHPSPCDLCVRAREGRHDETIFNYLSTFTGNTAEDRLQQWLRQPYADLPAMETPDVDPIDLPTQLHVFTRNEQDGFWNEEELTSEVVPPQPNTPLAFRAAQGTAMDHRQHTTSIKRAAKNMERGNPATSIEAPPPITSNNDGAQPAAAATTTTSGNAPVTSESVLTVGRSVRSRFYICLADGDAKFHADRPPTWEGSESVLMTLREVTDGQFIAKPSLGEDHVLSVSDQCITFFRIDVGGHTLAQVHRQSEITEERYNASSLFLKSMATKSGSAAQLHTELADQQKRTAILRQLVATTGHIAATSTGPNVDNVDIHAPKFTPPPMDLSKRRVHILGTVESTEGFDCSDIFLKCELVLPIAGFEIDVEANRKSGVAHRDEIISQTARASRYLNLDQFYVNMHHFNLPFELHAIAATVTAAAPRMVVSAWAQEGDKRQSLQGYGVVNLAPTPGMRKQTIQMWRPKMHGQETIRSLFVGGSASLVDPSDAAIPYQKRLDNLRALDAVEPIPDAYASLAVNSRSGLITDSCGQFTVQWMCTVQERAAAVNPNALRARYGRDI